MITKTPLFDKEDLIELAPAFSTRFEAIPSRWFQRPDSWYYGDVSSLPLYLDVLKGRDFIRYKLDIASDLSNLSLVSIADSSIQQRIGYDEKIGCRICEDRLVVYFHHGRTVKVYTTSGYSMPSAHSSRTPTAHIINRASLTKKVSAGSAYSFCPASGRLVYNIVRGDIVICDFL